MSATGQPGAPGPAAAVGQANATGAEGSSPWKTLIAVSVGSFMTILDATVVNVAVHALQLKYAAPTAEVQWVISGYALALGIATPLAGELGELYGGKRVFIGSLFGFTFASLLCGLAPNLGLLIAARVLQGLAGGFALPLGSARLFTAFPPGRRGVAFGAFGLVLVFAPMIGPLVGGAFVDAGLISWIFFINVPIGLLGVLLGSRFLAPDPPRPAVRHQVDWPSVAAVCPGFGGLLLGASLLGSGDRDAALLAFAVGLAALGFLVLRQLRGSGPGLFDLRLYRVRTYGIGSAINALGQVPFFGTQFLLPLGLQVVRGASALDAGLALLPLAISSGATGLLGGRLRDRIGPRLPLTAGFLLLASGIALLRADATDPAPATLVWPLLLAGAGAGVIPPLTQVTALSEVPRASVARGTSLLQATQRVCQALSVAVLATIVARAVGGASGPGGGDPGYRGRFAAGVADGYLLAMVLAVCCAALAALLPGWPIAGPWGAAAAPGRGAPAEQVPDAGG
ncbi:DHA2 family efflux MFS transporter permease subunit [Kitasatospora sp. NBC_01287]|uniref:DHA2 family efflux MFS transporter permease subunit n=1 Tax=Kitasatospora sp. NBC_01287 TaxID=2903573 RepID=UPI00225027FA|nr:DHA2 family efflux MFS transporter permease subunit [Kitasatospora sp. NBC_01287]MCX4750010.1 DHA2 family efflux MFS transporter permease subunit [Kitasatospora sp. NBC_01287]